MGKLVALLLASLFSFTYTGTTVTDVAATIDSTATHVFVKVWNNCSSTAYVAFSPGVTATNGIPLPAGGWIEFDEETAAGNRLYGVMPAATTCDLRVLEKKRP